MIHASSAIEIFSRCKRKHVVSLLEHAWAKSSCNLLPPMSDLRRVGFFFFFFFGARENKEHLNMLKDNFLEQLSESISYLGIFFKSVEHYYLECGFFNGRLLYCFCVDGMYVNVSEGMYASMYARWNRENNSPRKYFKIYIRMSSVLFQLFLLIHGNLYCNLRE